MSAELQKRKYLRRAKQILHKSEKKVPGAKKLQASVEPFSCNNGFQNQSDGPSLVRCNSDPTSAASTTSGPLVQRVTPTIRNKFFPSTSRKLNSHSGHLSGQSCMRTSMAVDRSSDQHSTPSPECGAAKLLFPSLSNDCDHLSSTPIPIIRGTHIGCDHFTSDTTTAPELNSSSSAKSTELECQLKIQTDINRELKRLLVASMGSDLQHRVNQIAKEKATISQDLDASLHQLAENYEEIDRVSIECDIWRSKFLASRLMVDELAGWKAEVSMQLRESQRALQCMLKESAEMGKHLLQCNAHLNSIGTHFKLDLRRDIDNGDGHDVDSTVLELARVNSSLARRIHEQLCSVREARDTVSNKAHCLVQSATAGERLAKQALGNTHQMQTCTGHIGERNTPQRLQLAEYSRLSSKTYSTVQHYLLGTGTTGILIHCNRCSGKIHNV